MSNDAALAQFIQQPVSQDMIFYLAAKAAEVIRCEPLSAELPTPPSTPPRDLSTNRLEQQLPDLETFITSIVQRSHVQVSTLMTTLVYLARLKKKLPPVAKGMRCTVHRIFLASLILSAKNLNDSSPKNKHWARYTSVRGYDGFGFSLTEVNLMEKQLLFLLDWDLNISKDDLYQHLDIFLLPIRQRIRIEEERKSTQFDYSISPSQPRTVEIGCTGRKEFAMSTTTAIKPSRPCRGETPVRRPESRSQTLLFHTENQPITDGTRLGSLSSRHRPTVNFDQFLSQTPPSSQVPELSRSGSASSIHSYESSPRLPSPSVVAQVHFLRDNEYESPRAAVALPPKPSKRARLGLFSRLLGERNMIEKPQVVKP